MKSVKRWSCQPTVHGFDFRVEQSVNGVTRVASYFVTKPHVLNLSHFEIVWGVVEALDHMMLTMDTGAGNV